jgi:hypothetical protein
MNLDAQHALNTAAQLLHENTDCSLTQAQEIVELIALGAIRWGSGE